MEGREAWPTPSGKRWDGPVWVSDITARALPKPRTVLELTPACACAPVSEAPPEPSISGTNALTFALDEPASRKPRSSKKLALTLIVLGCMGFAAGMGTWGIFTDSAPVTGNTFGTGTVILDDDDGGTAAMFSLTGLQPAGTDSGCIVVTYTGSVTADVRLYGSTTGTGLDQYLDLKVTRGTKTGAFDSCASFTADSTNYIGQGAGVIYNGTLQGFPDDYNTGTVDPTSGSPEAWTNGEAHAYRFDVTLQNNTLAQGKNATQTFTWEARDA